MSRLQFLRLLSLGFLFLNVQLYFPDFWNPLVLLVLLLVALGLGIFLAGRNWRPWLSLGLLVLVPWLLHTLVLGLGSLWAWLPLGPWDAFPLVWNRHFWVWVLPWTYAALLSYAVQKQPQWAYWERLANAIWLFLIFFWQRSYEWITYGHPSFLALAVLFFLVVEFLVLFLAHSLLQQRSAPRGEARENQSPPKEGGFSGRKRLAWLRTVPGVLLTLLLGILFLWFLMGRYQEESISSGGGLMRPDLFRFDFSPFVQLESRISMDDQLVLLYRQEGPGDRFLLRRYLMSGYDSQRGFFVDPPPGGEDEIIPPLGRRPLVFPETGHVSRQETKQEYYIINFDPSSLLALNEPTRVIPFSRWDESSFVGMYQVYSQTASINPALLEDWTAPVKDQQWWDHYTDYGHDQRIADLATLLTQDLENQLDQIYTILYYLKFQYFYSLNPGVASDGNQLHHFLFDSRKGYCSYFAFSMTLMLRSLGIPSRVAVGFFVNPDEALLNFYPVRANQAHAWVEVYFPELGWLEFDPTAENLAPGEEMSFSEAIPPETLVPMIQEILGQDLQPLDEEPEIWNPSQASREITFLGFVRNRVFPLVGFLPLVYLLLVWTGRLYRELLIRRNSAGDRDRRRTTRDLYDWLRCLLRLAGQGPGEGESVEAFATGLGNQDFRELSLLYQKARYAREYSPEDFQRARSAYRKSLSLLPGPRPWSFRMKLWFLPRGWWP